MDAFETTAVNNTWKFKKYAKYKGPVDAML